MPTTTPPLPSIYTPEFGQELGQWFIQLWANATLQAAQMLWDIFLQFLIQNWLYTIPTLFLLLTIATFRALTGRWGQLASLLYNTLYFGTLFVVGLIWGPQVFVSDWFDFARLVILYPLCYWLVGRFLSWSGLRRF